MLPVLKPFSRAPAVIIGFQVDPGANWPWVARDSSGVPARSEYSRFSCLLVMPPDQTSGS